MAYFRNNAVNLLNIHYAIHSIAMTGAGAFFAAYLFKAGVSVPGVFLTFAAILTGRFLIRPMIIPLAARFGMRVLIITGTLLSACQYPLLSFVHGVGPALYAIIALGSVADTFYWPSYHAYFARVGDDEHRGHQISAREAIVALIGVASPLLTGFLLVTFGPRIAFSASGLIVATSALPLLWTPAFRVANTAAGAIRAAVPGVLLFMGDGFIGGIYVFVWQVALFQSLHENFMAFGGALAIAAVVGAVGGLYLGALHRRRWTPRRLHRLRLAGRRAPDARRRHARSGARRLRQCGQRARRLPLHPDDDDGRLHARQKRALHAALPRGDGSGLGPGRCDRAGDGSPSRLERCAPLGDPPAGHSGGGVAVRAAPRPLCPAAGSSAGPAE